MSDERLSTMEDKLDKLSEAFYAITRIEERMFSVFNRLENIDGSIKKMDGRVDKIEKQAMIRGQKIALPERLFWIVVTGAVDLAFIFLR